LTRPQALSGVFNWALEGLRMYRETGLNVPENIARATAGYRHDSDKIAQFMEECTERVPDWATPTSQLYERYGRWCRDNRIYPESHTKFTQTLRTKGYTIEKTRWHGNENVRYVFNIALVPQAFSDYNDHRAG